MTRAIVIVPYPPSVNGVALSERESDVLFCLVDGRWKTSRAMIDAILFFDDADRGFERRNIHAYVYKLRRLLEPTGLAIVNEMPRGYRLVWLDALQTQEAQHAKRTLRAQTTQPGQAARG